MSANHAGSIARAKEIIHAAKEAGADCVKIQTYTPDTLTIDCDNKYFQISGGAWYVHQLKGSYFIKLHAYFFQKIYGRLPILSGTRL